jgi:metal-responsive CopG/Arc/MetJ family transcriptional regulator
MEKRRGRPATGMDPVIGVRLPSGLVERLDQHARIQTISRSEAIRRFIELGLAAAKGAGGANARRKAAD